MQMLQSSHDHSLCYRAMYEKAQGYATTTVKHFEVLLISTKEELYVFNYAVEINRI